MKDGDALKASAGFALFPLAMVSVVEDERESGVGSATRLLPIRERRTCPVLESY